MSKRLSSYLIGNWSGEFEETLEKLRVAVVTINSTRVDLSMAEGLSSWIASTFSLFRMGGGRVYFLHAALEDACFVCGWSAVCKHVLKKDKVIITQALAALECGSSPQIWLCALTTNIHIAFAPLGLVSPLHLGRYVDSFHILALSTGCQARALHLKCRTFSFLQGEQV